MDKRPILLIVWSVALLVGISGAVIAPRVAVWGTDMPCLQQRATRCVSLVTKDGTGIYLKVTTYRALRLFDGTQHLRIQATWCGWMEHEWGCDLSGTSLTRIPSDDW